MKKLLTSILFTGFLISSQVYADNCDDLELWVTNKTGETLLINWSIPGQVKLQSLPPSSVPIQYATAFNRGAHRNVWVGFTILKPGKDGIPNAEIVSARGEKEYCGVIGDGMFHGGIDIYMPSQAPLPYILESSKSTNNCSGNGGHCTSREPGRVFFTISKIPQATH